MRQSKGTATAPPRARAIVLLFVVGSLASCGLNVPAPVRTAAIASLPREEAETLHEQLWDYKDLRVTCGSRHDLTPDERSSGFEEKWCVVVSGTVRGSVQARSSWISFSRTMIVSRLSGSDAWGATLPHGEDCPCP